MAFSYSFCLMYILASVSEKRSSFSASNQIMGVRKTTDFLEKATWTLAGAMLLLCVIAALAIPRDEVGGKSAIQEQVQNAPANQVIPSFTTQPQNNDNGTTSGGETTPTEEPQQ